MEMKSKLLKQAEVEEFSIAAHLDSPETIAAYLNDIISANDAALLAAALGDIARAKGMSEVAEYTGITREALYKALRSNASPRFETVSKVCSAFGVTLVAQARQQTGGFTK
jgi:probable addiction module antidote protein